MDKIEEMYTIYALKSNTYKNTIIEMEIPLRIKDAFLEKFHDCNVTEATVNNFIEDNK